MFVSILTLATAIFLSCVSAYYSVLGLLAIFSTTAIPIVIMGVILEFSKIVTVVWLHYNWGRASWKIKTYLCSAVFFLAIITNIGVFGFLSKSHLDQAVPSGDIQAQVSLFDEKIKTERDNIDAARKALTQLDSAVDQLMARTNDENGATKATDLRRSQRRERTNLTHDIDLSQKKITQLQEERAPIASKFRKAEADVGPIRYIAALIYGDNPSQSTLESAVRLVIIIIVLVFDPLAIVLLLASTTSIDWAEEERKKKKETKLIPIVEAEKAKTLAKAECEVEIEKFKLEECEKCIAYIDKNLREAEEQLIEKESEQVAAEEEIVELSTQLSDRTDQINDLAPMLNNLEEECASLISEKEHLEKEVKETEEKFNALNAELEKKNKVKPPKLEPDSNITTIPANASFGVTFPPSPSNGDFFLRVDFMPSKLFKWVGNRWVEIDKEKSDIYAYNIEYIKLLVEKVGTGEYDVDDLSHTEQRQIEEYLRNNP